MSTNKEESLSRIRKIALEKDSKHNIRDVSLLNFKEKVAEEIQEISKSMEALPASFFMIEVLNQRILEIEKMRKHKNVPKNKEDVFLKTVISIIYNEIDVINSNIRIKLI